MRETIIEKGQSLRKRMAIKKMVEKENDEERKLYYKYD